MFLFLEKNIQHIAQNLYYARTMTIVITIAHILKEKNIEQS